MSILNLSVEPFRTQYRKAPPQNSQSSQPGYRSRHRGWKLRSILTHQRSQLLMLLSMLYVVSSDSIFPDEIEVIHCGVETAKGLYMRQTTDDPMPLKILGLMYKDWPESGEGRKNKWIDELKERPWYLKQDDGKYIYFRGASGHLNWALCDPSPDWGCDVLYETQRTTEADMTAPPKTWSCNPALSDAPAPTLVYGGDNSVNREVADVSHSSGDRPTSHLEPYVVIPRAANRNTQNPPPLQATATHTEGRKVEYKNLSPALQKKINDKRERPRVALDHNTASARVTKLKELETAQEEAEKIFLDALAHYKG